MRHGFVSKWAVLPPETGLLGADIGLTASSGGFHWRYSRVIPGVMERGCPREVGCVEGGFGGCLAFVRCVRARAHCGLIWVLAGVVRGVGVGAGCFDVSSA